MGQVSGHLTRLPATYENTKKAVVSKPVNVTVWRWIPLKEYAPYYEAQPGAAIFGTTTFNGVAYSGWGAPTYSHTGAWESRCTPGRHCKSFKAVLGVGDISDDGWSGSISFTADDEQIYTSPTLAPGMSVPATVPWAKPYRFGIQLLDTHPAAPPDTTTWKRGPYSSSPPSCVPTSDHRTGRSCRAQGPRLTGLEVGQRLSSASSKKPMTRRSYSSGAVSIALMCGASGTVHSDAFGPAIRL
jgi:hypothetical protein